VLFSVAYLMVRRLLSCLMVLARREASKDAELLALGQRGRRSSVTVLMNGGQIAYTDVAASLGSGRPVVVLAGSGRTADAIAKARAGSGGDNRAVEIAASPLTTVADVGEAGVVAAAIEAALDGG
jgi:SLOG in TRPM, prokaryote